MGIRTLLIFGVVFFLNACSVMKDDKLGLERMEYSETDIRLDGYWWKELQSNVPRIEVYFFYENGITLYGRALKLSELELKEEEFKSGDFANHARESKTGWGVFHINGSQIEFETWEPSSGGSLKTAVRSGEVVDDETFVVTSFLNNYSGETSIRNDTFYFKEFRPKPDSSNTFIE